MAFARIQVDDSSEAVIDAYCRYERGQRGLAELTVSKSAYTARQFLAWRAETGRPQLEDLEPIELEEFVLHEAGRRKRATMRSTVAVVGPFMGCPFATGVTARVLCFDVPL